MGAINVSLGRECYFPGKEGLHGNYRHMRSVLYRCGNTWNKSNKIQGSFPASFFSCSVLRIKPRALDMVGKCSSEVSFVLKM
jgi:hypothetical protein